MVGRLARMLGLGKRPLDPGGILPSPKPPQGLCNHLDALRVRRGQSNGGSMSTPDSFVDEVTDAVRRDRLFAASPQIRLDRCRAGRADRRRGRLTTNGRRARATARAQAVWRDGVVAPALEKTDPAERDQGHWLRFPLMPTRLALPELAESRQPCGGQGGGAGGSGRAGR